jgi:hypothetical protein
VDESYRSLRRLLSQRDSYARIAAKSAAGRLPRFPVALFGHIGDVYRRVETAGHDFGRIRELRLTTLVHEEPHESLAKLLGSADLLDFWPTVAAVTAGFGRVWKVRTEDELRHYVEVTRPDLAAILLFERAHEGQATPQMERAAELGGLQLAFECWVERLAEGTPRSGHRWRRGCSGR